MPTKNLIYCLTSQHVDHSIGTITCFQCLLKTRTSHNFADTAKTTHDQIEHSQTTQYSVTGKLWSQPPLTTTAGYMSCMKFQCWASWPDPGRVNVESMHDLSHELTSRIGNICTYAGGRCSPTTSASDHIQLWKSACMPQHIKIYRLW